MKRSKNTSWRMANTYLNQDTGRLYVSARRFDRSKYNGNGTRKAPEQTISGAAVTVDFLQNEVSDAETVERT